MPFGAASLGLVWPAVVSFSQEMSLGASALSGVAGPLCVAALDLFGRIVSLGEAVGVLFGELCRAVERVGEPVQERRELPPGRDDVWGGRAGVVGEFRHAARLAPRGRLVAAWPLDLTAAW